MPAQQVLTPLLGPKALLPRAIAIGFSGLQAVVIFGVGTVLVAALWLRLFPALARRDRMV